MFARARVCLLNVVPHAPVLRFCSPAVVDVEGSQAIQETQASIARIQEMTRQAEVCQGARDHVDDCMNEMQEHELLQYAQLRNLN